MTKCGVTAALLFVGGVAHAGAVKPQTWRVDGRIMTVWGQPSRSRGAIRDAYPDVYFTNGLQPRERLRVTGPDGPVELVGITPKRMKIATPTAKAGTPASSVATRSGVVSAARGSDGDHFGAAGGFSMPAYPTSELYAAMNVPLTIAEARDEVRKNRRLGIVATFTSSPEARLARERDLQTEQTASWAQGVIEPMKAREREATQHASQQRAWEQQATDRAAAMWESKKAEWKARQTGSRSYAPGTSWWKKP